MAMNEQLSALVDAGVPIDTGLDARNTAKALEKINATVARRVSRGVSLADALVDEERSPVYCRMMEAGIKSGQLSAALAGSSRLAGSVDDSISAVRLAFFYPLTVWVLAYVGFVAFCLYIVPRLEDAVVGFEILPGAGLQILKYLRHTLPLWVWIPPALLLLLAVRRFVIQARGHGKSQIPFWVFWLPGMRRAISDERCANFATILSRLIDEGAPLAENLNLAAGACGDRGLRDGAESLATGLKLGQAPRDDSPAALAFPPFLRWTLWHAEETVGLQTALPMAATIYQASAARRIERLRLVLPVLTCVVVGGGAALLYGMALFVPVVEMLRSLGG
jgi:type II secretory pathway component PulF